MVGFSAGREPIMAEFTSNIIETATNPNSIRLANLTSIQFHLGCRGGVLNEYPRDVLKKQAALAHRNCFLTSSNFSKLPKDTHRAEITIACLKSCDLVEPRLLTSSNNSNFRAFRYKYMADLLPIGSNLKKWGCVANRNGACKRCESAEKTLAHLTSCTRICIDFNEMIQELSLVIGADKSRPLTEKLRAAPLELSLFDGAFNHNLSTKIQEILEASFNYEFMCKAILKCIWWAVYYKIWLTRCQ
jgi:hypothetical protein